MLARYLRTSQQPIRYAMDPVHAAAIRNYLALTTRAYDVPGLYQQARPHLPGGREGELLHHLFSAMIGEHDPDALAAFLDAHQDYTGQPTPSDYGEHPHPHMNLLQTLAGLHDAATGRHQYHNRPVTESFASARMFDPQLRQRLRQRYLTSPVQGTLAIRQNLSDLLHHGEYGNATLRIPATPSGLYERMAALPYPLHQGDPMAMVDTHDVMRDYMDVPGVNISPAFGAALQVRRKASGALHDIAIPHLLTS